MPASSGARHQRPQLFGDDAVYRFNALGHPIKGIGRLGAVVRGLLVILGMVLIGRNQAQTGKLSMQPVTDHGMISGVSK